VERTDHGHPRGAGLRRHRNPGEPAQHRRWRPSLHDRPNTEGGLDTDLEAYLREKGVWHRFIDKQETVHTADASEATGIDLHRITKNLVSKTNKGEYVLLVVPGDRRVNLKAAAEALGVKNVRLMPFGEAESISGYPPGGTPSVGHKTRMRTVLDSELTEFETLYCGGGTRDRLVELKVSDVISLNDAIVSTISKTS
jgi:Cys-tRNA(Pro)/Cys-tRNA(Cys) deacylase